MTEPFRPADPVRQPAPVGGLDAGLVTVEPRGRVSRRNRAGMVAAGLVGAVSLVGLGALGATALNSGENNDSQTPGAGRTTPTTPTTPTKSEGTDLDNSINKDTWPMTAEAAATQMGLSKVAAKYLVQGDNKVWNAEFFPFNNGVTFENGKHMLNGVAITDAGKIFDFSQEPEWQTVTNQSDGTLFARTGGAGPDGQKNVSRFIGPGGQADNIEQAALIPTPEECKNDPHTASYRNAAVEFVYNKDVQNKVVTVEWYNPTTEKLEVIDGKTISSYAKGMNDGEKEAFADTLKKLPMNYPLTPEQAVAETGGKTNPENWTFNTDTGVWTFEGFNLANGVNYDKAGGVLRKGGQIVGADTAYNYSDWKSAKANQWAKSWTFPTLDGVYGFARTGGGSDFRPNTSYYGVEGTVSTNGKAGFEQGAIIPVTPRTDCTAADALIKAVAKDAQRQLNNPDVEEVIIVTKTEAVPVTLK